MRKGNFIFPLKQVRLPMPKLGFLGYYRHVSHPLSTSVLEVSAPIAMFHTMCTSCISVEYTALINYALLHAISVPYT